MTKPEYVFQGRLIKILTAKGYLAINAASKQPFDVVAVKDQVAYPLEVKARKTDYPKEQQEMQRLLCLKSNSHFFVIRQSKKRGKMHLYGPVNKYYRQLEKDLQKYLE